MDTVYLVEYEGRDPYVTDASGLREYLEEWVFNAVVDSHFRKAQIKLYTGLWLTVTRYRYRASRERAS